LRQRREVILITGATGFVGGAVAAALPDREIVVVSRKGREASPSGRGAMTWENLDVEGVDAIVNLAGETIAGRWTEKKKQAIHDSRILGTRALVDAIARAKKKPRVLVSGSAVGIYGETFDEVDESAPPGSDFLARVCVDWEAEAERAVAEGVRVVKTRLGLVLGRDGGVLRELAPLYRAGLGGPIGGGKQWWSWIHIEDVARAIVRAIEDERWRGPINLVAGSATQRDFAKALGEALHRPAFMPTPAFALRAALGDGADPILLGQRVVSRRSAALAHTWVFPELRSALTAALSGRTSEVPRDGS
jgi:uncharacterized protein